MIKATNKVARHGERKPGQPKKEKCKHPRSDGSPCNAWSMDNGGCATHYGRVGAPKGNKNAVTHGAYSGLFSKKQQEFLKKINALSTEDEVHIVALQIHDVLKYVKDLKIGSEEYWGVMTTLKELVNSSAGLKVKNQLLQQSENSELNVILPWSE